MTNAQRTAKKLLRILRRRQYAHNGLAGCVQQTLCRKSGLLVGVYQAGQAGMESDPETPWATVCEFHGNLVCHATLKAARAWAADPTVWCSECQRHEEKRTP